MKKANIKAKTIVNAFLTVYPMLSKFAYSASANKLMLEESEIMTAVLQSLMRREIPAVPIHDSVLFPKPYTKIVKKVMQQCYKKHTGFKIKVK